MKMSDKRGAFRKPGVRVMTRAVTLVLLALPAYASAQALPDTLTVPSVTSVTDLFTQGRFTGDFRTLYYGAHNAFYNQGVNQNTLSYGGGIGYTTAALYGFSVGVSAYIQRGIAHPDDPAHVDGALGPNVTSLGEAYLRWEGDGFKFTAGNQSIDVPFASSYDWRIAPDLFQGFSGTYGTADNYVTAFRMFRWKSWIGNSFSKQTAYNQSFDSFSSIGNQTTNGFYGAGAAGTLPLDPVVTKGQAWYMVYQDYARLTYLEGSASLKDGDIKPFVGAQVFFENGDGRELLGPVDSHVYGLQLGAKRNSLTVELGYDYIRPNGNSYLNGALVTPYAHNQASGPLFAQPFITSTQDLGAGNAYSFDVFGDPIHNLTVGGRYSFMDLKSTAGGVSLNQSEYLAYVTYSFSGKLKGLSISDFVAMQSSPAEKNKFVQNRLELEYDFGT
jgi:hypothetical protein